MRCCRHVARRFETLVACIHDLRSSPDQNVGVPDRRHAMLDCRLDVDRDLSRSKIDWFDAWRLGEGEEWIAHEILCVPQCHGTRTCLKQLKLFASACEELGGGHERRWNRQRRAGEMRLVSLCSHLAGWTVPRPGSERERLDGAGIRAIFAAREGANLSHGDLLELLFDPRPSRALMAICERRDGRPAAFRPAAKRRMAG